jgi:hypothetical protein
MTAPQLYKYRAEWAKAWKALRASGLATYDQETTRKRWHLFIGAVNLRGPEAGQPKSSTRLTNDEFDRFLKRCAAAQEPGSLKRQLDLDDQPLIRLRFATDPLLDLIQMHEEQREAYLAGIYRNLQRPRATKGERVFEIAEMPDADLQLVVGALTHTVKHKLGVEHDHPHTGKGPQSKWAHRVGHRRAGPKLASQDEASMREPDPEYVPPSDQPF